MSASEKMKTLRDARLAELGGRLPDGHPFIDLWRALPQIVSLVEAAEHSRQWAQDEVLEGPPELGLIDMELTTALDDLEKALP